VYCLLVGPWLPYPPLLLVNYSFQFHLSSIFSSSSKTSMLFLDLPIVLFPFILPSITSFSSPSPLKTYHIHLFFLLMMRLCNYFYSPTLNRTYSFVSFSVQLIFFILLHSHISIASNLLISSFLMVHVSESYNNVVHTKVIINFFLVFSSFSLIVVLFFY